MLGIIVDIILISCGVIVGYVIGVWDRKKYHQEERYDFDTELTIAEQCEDALDEAKRIINEPLK